MVAIVGRVNYKMSKNELIHYTNYLFNISGRSEVYRMSFKMRVLKIFSCIHRVSGPFPSFQLLD